MTCNECPYKVACEKKSESVKAEDCLDKKAWEKDEQDFYEEQQYEAEQLQWEIEQELRMQNYDTVYGDYTY